MTLGKHAPSDRCFRCIELIVASPAHFGHRSSDHTVGSSGLLGVAKGLLRTRTTSSRPFDCLELPRLESKSKKGIECLAYVKQRAHMQI